MKNIVKNIDFFIRVYDNAFTKEECSKFISYIEEGEKSPGLVSSFANGGDGSVVNKLYKESEDLNISYQYPQEVPFIVSKTKECLGKYEKDVKMRVPFYQTENIAGRVYRKNTGFYRAHVDSGNPSNIDRLLTILVYLNDVEEGGELEFPRLGLKYKAKEGRIIIFPSSWMFHHAARKPISNDRYILRVFISGANFDVKQHSLYIKSLEDANKY